MFTSLFVVMLELWVVCSTESTNASSLGLPRLSGPSETLVNTVIELNCELLIYPDNEPILLQLFKQGNRDKVLSEYTSLNGEVASFPMYIKLYHEGDLECVAKAQNNSNIEPTVSNIHRMRVVEPVADAEIDVRSDAVEFFEETPLELRCRITTGNHVSYNWLLNGQPVSQVHLNNDHLLIKRTTSEDSGSYTCEANNHFNNTKYSTSRSAAVVITIKDVVSDPDISFTPSKDASHNYSAVVTCQSTKGTPPVFFSLHNRTHLVANTTVGETTAKFKVPLVLDKHLGWLHCQANNGNHTAYSKWIPLDFVPVDGPVVMHYHYDVGENYAVTSLTFYCKAAKGSLPRYQWFLNKTLLPERGAFHYVVDQPPEQSMLLLSVGKWSAGTYHCEVSDSFDNTTAISSKGWYVDEEVLNRLPVTVVAVVLGSFAVLVLLVCSCCWTGVLLRQYEEKSPVGLEMERMETAYEGEPDLSEYGEDADVAKAARGDEFDQASEASVDEWPQIEKEKETLEDEAEAF